MTSLDHDMPGNVPQPGSTAGFGFDEFVTLVDSCRAELVAKERKKAGFTDEKIAELRRVFDQFDTDRSGVIGILKTFGWEPKTRKEQQELVKKLDIARDRA